tara:strand:- start:1598 stop:2194 length:597 start_codon:yes stop_codon:yes gene_type:complete
MFTIELAILLGTIAIISKHYKDSTKDNFDAQTRNLKGYGNNNFHGGNDGVADGSLKEVRLRPMDLDTFSIHSSVCGDGITDSQIRKNVVFRAKGGLAVQDVEMTISICDNPLASFNLNECNPNNINRGVLRSSCDYSVPLYVGFYTLTITNRNSQSLPNDGAIVDNGIEVLIDGFSIGELPMTLANDSETYNLIVNAD